MADYLDDPRVRMAMRDAEIYKMRKEQKLSLRALGKQFGISYERVRQIIEMIDNRKANQRGGG